MDCNEPFRHGVLSTPPHGKLLKRTWQKKYYALYQANNCGIERVEIFDTEEQFLRHRKPIKLIALSDCIKVVQTPLKNQHNVFEVICRNQSYQFSAETTQELAEWISAFQYVAFGQQRRESYPMLSICGLQSSACMRNSLSIEFMEVQQEENMIYSSMSGPERFTVIVVATEASERCGLHGSYQLTVTPVNISISQPVENASATKALFTWAFRHIRRFSQNKGTFSFEAGRKCTTGEGLFSFETSEGKAIFYSVSMHLKSLDKNDPSASQKNSGKLENSSSLSNRSSMFIDNPSSSKCGSSPVAAERSHVKDKSGAKNQPNPQDNIYENTALGQRKLRPPIVKPPRKNKVSTSGLSASLESVSAACETSVDMSPTSSPLLPKEDFLKAFQSKTPPSSSPQESSELMYAMPEERKDAWKTFALPKDNIHEENIPSDIAALYASVDVTNLSPKSTYLKRHVSVPEVGMTKEPVPFRQISLFSPRPRTSEGSYDHLFQFGSPVKNTPASDHIYKKLNSPTGVANTGNFPYNSVPNEYDQPTLEDDSETATTYATPVDALDLSPKSSSKDVDVKHMFQNNQAYSVVIKSKNSSLQQL